MSNLIMQSGEDSVYLLRVYKDSDQVRITVPDVKGNVHYGFADLQAACAFITDREHGSHDGSNSQMVVAKNQRKGE